MKICIYHKNCFDGICSAWVVQKKFPGVTLYPMNYGDSLDWLTQGWNQGIYGIEDELFIVDFSFARNIMIHLKGMFPNLLVLDHHKTAEKECENLDFCKFDMNESGSSLAWKYFFPKEEIPLLVRYIKDRDLWLYKEKRSEEVNSFIQSFTMAIENQEMLYEQLEEGDGLRIAISGGESILRYKNTMVEAMCKTVAFTDHYPFFDIRIPIVNASILFSEVGNELCKKFPNAPFAAYYFDRLSDGKRQWGLRSIGDFDVSEVAKKLGGGGHRNAAGFIQDLGGL